MPSPPSAFPFPISISVVVVLVVVGRFFLLMMPEALVKLSRLKLLAASNCRHQRSFAPSPDSRLSSFPLLASSCTRYKLELDVNSATIVPAAPDLPPPSSSACECDQRKTQLKSLHFYAAAQWRTLKLLQNNEILCQIGRPKLVRREREVWRGLGQRKWAL